MIASGRLARQQSSRAIARRCERRLASAANAGGRGGIGVELARTFANGSRFGIGAGHFDAVLMRAGSLGPGFHLDDDLLARFQHGQRFAHDLSGDDLRLAAAEFDGFDAVAELHDDLHLPRGLRAAIHDLQLVVGIAAYGRGTGRVVDDQFEISNCFDCGFCRGSSGSARLRGGLSNEPIRPGRIQLATVILVTALYAAKQPDAKVRSAAATVCQELRRRLLGGLPTDSYLRDVTKLGRTIATEGFPELDQTPQAPMMMSYKT